MKLPYLLLASFVFGIVIGVGVMSLRAPHEVVPESVTSPKSVNQRTVRSSEPVSERKKIDELELKLLDFRADYFALNFSEVVVQISKLQESDFPRVFEQAGEDETIHTLLYRRWAELNAREALRYLVSETDYCHWDCNESGRPDFAFLVLSEMLDQEGTAALSTLRNFFEHDMGESIGYEYGDWEGFQSLFRKWALLDFDSVMVFWAEQKEGCFFDGSAIGLAMGAAEVGKSRVFLEWIATNHESGWEEMEKGAREWALRDSRAAIEWASDHEEVLDGAALNGVMKGWIERDPKELLEWVSSNGRGALLKEVARSHPAEVAGWLREQTTAGEAYDEVRAELLSPLDSRKLVPDDELEHYFELVQGWRQSPQREREASDLERLFLGATQIPVNYKGEGRSFSLYHEQRLEPLLEKWGYEDEFTEFRSRREQDALEYSRLDDERAALFEAAIEVKFPDED